MLHHIFILESLVLELKTILDCLPSLCHYFQEVFPDFPCLSFEGLYINCALCALKCKVPHGRDILFTFYILSISKIILNIHKLLDTSLIQINVHKYKRQYGGFISYSESARSKLFHLNISLCIVHSGRIWYYTPR